MKKQILLILTIIPSSTLKVSGWLPTFHPLSDLPSNSEIHSCLLFFKDAPQKIMQKEIAKNAGIIFISINIKIVNEYNETTIYFLKKTNEKMHGFSTRHCINKGH